MNHRRTLAAVAILAAVGFAACGEADSDPTPVPAAAQPDAARAEATRAERVTVSADAAEHWANLEAQDTPAGGQLSADAAEHWASAEVTAKVQPRGQKAE